MQWEKHYMTGGWITRANGNPPMIAIGIGNTQPTWKGKIENGEFCVNFPNAKDLFKTDYIGIISGAKEDKSHLYTARYEYLKKALLNRRMSYISRMQADPENGFSDTHTFCW
jgi:flavin reductase (DIM6/NTAB) family NADH-FMN oxidoreductase RutF